MTRPPFFGMVRPVMCTWHEPGVVGVKLRCVRRLTLTMLDVVDWKPPDALKITRSCSLRSGLRVLEKTPLLLVVNVLSVTHEPDGLPLTSLRRCTTIEPWPMPQLFRVNLPNCVTECDAVRVAGVTVK